MNAVQALKAARDAGVRLGVDGDALTLDADAAPPPRVLDLLSRHKAGVLALLRTGSDGWSGEDWRALFDERAAIAEFDGGFFSCLRQATGRLKYNRSGHPAPAACLAPSLTAQIQTVNDGKGKQIRFLGCDVAASSQRWKCATFRIGPAIPGWATRNCASHLKTQKVSRETFS